MEAIRKLTALGQKHFPKLPAAENGRALLALPAGMRLRRHSEARGLHRVLLLDGLLPGIFCTAAHNVKKGDAIWKAHSESCSVSCWNGFRKMDFYQKTPI